MVLILSAQQVARLSSDCPLDPGARLTGNKYGFGGEKEVRPYLANLAVRRSARRRGIGRVLGMACEELARGWGFEDILLQVEEDNVAARELYRVRHTYTQ